MTSNNIKEATKIKVIAIGDSEVGKTSILTRFVC